MLVRRPTFWRPFIGRSRRRQLSRRNDPELDTYRAYLTAVGHQIGELSPVDTEELRDIHGKLRMAARTLGVHARTWIDDGKVYFFVRDDSVA